MSFLNQKENELIHELINYALCLPVSELEHLVWIGEGMVHATQKIEKEEDN